MRAAILVICAVAVLAAATAAQQAPGLKFSMQSSTLNSVVGDVIADINNKILQTPIPDQSGSAGVPILGKIKWKVTNIKIKSLDFTDSALSTVDGVGFQLTTQNANAHITLDWEVSLKSIITSFDEKGTASIKTTNADATWQVAVTEANEHLSAALSVNSFVMNNLRIHVTADDIPRWLLEIVTALLDRPVKRYLEKQVQEEVQSLVTDLNTSLQSMNTILSVGDALALDVSYPQNPVFTSTYYSIPWLGEWLVASNPSMRPNISAVSMPDFGTNGTVNVMVNEYFFDTLGWALWAGNVLSLSEPMNTDVWKVAIPGLYKAYPDQNMTLGIDLREEANATISASKGIQLTMQFGLDYNIDFANGSNPLVLTLSMTVDFDAVLGLNQTEAGISLVGAVSTFTVKAAVVDSSIGKVSTTLLNTALKTLITTIIKPKLNSLLGAGIALPIPNERISDISVAYADGYQALGITFM